MISDTQLSQMPRKVWGWGDTFVLNTHMLKFKQRRGSMAISKHLFRGCVHYGIKLSLSAATSIAGCVKASGLTLWDNARSRHWFEKFRLGDISLYDDTSVFGHMSWTMTPWRRPQRRTTIKLVVRLPKAFRFLSLHLHRIEKMYILIKMVQHTLWESKTKKRVIGCFSLFSLHLNVPISDRVLTNDNKWVVFDTLKLFRHRLSLWDPVLHMNDHLYTHAISALAATKNLWKNHYGPVPAAVGMCATATEAEWASIRPHVMCVARHTSYQLCWETRCQSHYSPDLALIDDHLGQRRSWKVLSQMR